MDRDTFHQPRVLKALSSLALNASKEGASTASLGNLFQHLTTLIVKNFSLKVSSGGRGLKVGVMLGLVVCLRWIYILLLVARWMLCLWFSFQLNGEVGTGGKTLGRKEMDL